MIISKVKSNDSTTLLIDDFKGFKMFLDVLYKELNSPLCKCKKDFTISRKIISENFSDYHIEPLLDYFEQEYINCDCEILFILKAEYYY